MGIVPIICVGHICALSPQVCRQGASATTCRACPHAVFELSDATKSSVVSVMSAAALPCRISGEMYLFLALVIVNTKLSNLVHRM